MVVRLGGSRRKSRHIMLKTAREKGKISIARYFQTFKEGEKVLLKLDSAVPKGTFIPRRFQGKIGTVNGMQGKCYMILLSSGKSVIVHPAHLRKVVA